MQLDRNACYRALRTRDARFDGRFFTGVRTTGVYCRPICPARTPHLKNIEFFPSAAAAQEAGFRPCLRCRPESSPELAAWRGTSATVTRALAMIGNGGLDGDEGGVERLAARLGIGERQLRRLFKKHLGVAPIVVAQTRRVLFAKQLLHETRMSMTDVALAAGFGSVRRFNDTFSKLYSRPPSALRRTAGVAKAKRASEIRLRLSFAPPYDWQAMIGFFAARAIAGIEVVEPECYRRTISLNGEDGTIVVAPVAGKPALAVTIDFPDVSALPEIVARVRRMFDLGADVAAIGAHLSEDPRLASLVEARPGLRVPGAWDGFELAVRAILGQQITVVGARALAAKLVAIFGEPLSAAGADLDTKRRRHLVSVSGEKDGLLRLFPTPECLAVADLSVLGMPRARTQTISTLARAVVADPMLLSPDHGLESAVERLRDLPGIGEWTAQYIAMRALREPDAFPADDVGLARAIVSKGGTRPKPAKLLEMASKWRPWRAYAAQHLWNAPGDSVSALEIKKAAAG